MTSMSPRPGRPVGGVPAPGNGNPPPGNGHRPPGEVPPRPEDSPPGRGSASFLLIGVVAVAFTAVAVPLGMLNWVPSLGELINRPGGVSTIVTLVLAIALWVLLFAFGRLFQGGREHTANAEVRKALGTGPSSGSPRRIGGHVQESLRDTPFRNSAIARRIDALAGSSGTGKEQAKGALAARSELDHARGDVSYGPARALVWALPALGFLGTAAEMSRAVSGLGASVSRTTEFADLRTALTTHVIGPLADAFSVTLLALGASVICHLALTWAHNREQRILLEVEEVTLEVLHRVNGPAPPAQQPGTASLNTEISKLGDQIEQASRAFDRSVRAIASIDLDQLQHLRPVAELGAAVQSIEQRLGLIHAEMSQEIVVTRRGAASPEPPR
ncbi:hypothetical protein [Saccharopolyspora taberi]|uniref:MotA/TolQ/ExbB proton channel domain-containing protein n=1 Tax=Saccharopolyspora taberi TaxID=60895 RepID=A0ABN3VGY0_9PSEU